MCNKFIKFGILIEKAKELGCENLATGHYIKKENGKLKKAKDDKKDQSYFLFNLNQDQIDFSLFPLGDYSKPEIVKMAKEYNVFPKVGESQDICFVENGKYAQFIEDRLGKKLPDASLIDKEKNEFLKQHKSIINYTVGQRKGLDIGGLSNPKYVVKIDAEKNEVILGKKEDLFKKTFELCDINWLGDKNFTTGEVFVKLRYNSKGLKAYLDLTKNECVLLEAGIVSPGQAAVFYDGDGFVLGGGFQI
jgi:tRNA-specific 2-thiouridylase